MEYIQVLFFTHSNCEFNFNTRLSPHKRDGLQCAAGWTGMIMTNMYSRASFTARWANDRNYCGFSNTDAHGVCIRFQIKSSSWQQNDFHSFRETKLHMSGKQWSLDMHVSASDFPCTNCNSCFRPIVRVYKQHDNWVYEEWMPFSAIARERHPPRTFWFHWRFCAKYQASDQLFEADSILWPWTIEIKVNLDAAEVTQRGCSINFQQVSKKLWLHKFTQARSDSGIPDLESHKIAPKWQVYLCEWGKKRIVRQKLLIQWNARPILFIFLTEHRNFFREGAIVIVIAHHHDRDNQGHSMLHLRHS